MIIYLHCFGLQVSLFIVFVRNDMGLVTDWSWAGACPFVWFCSMGQNLLNTILPNMVPLSSVDNDSTFSNTKIDHEKGKSKQKSVC